MWQEDAYYLKRSMVLAKEAFDKGNEPFGALLVDADGEIILEQLNAVATGGPTAHSEKELIVAASKRYTPEFLWECTMYCILEPCAMCTAAAYWANIGKIKFVIEEKELGKMFGGQAAMDLPSREVISRSSKSIQVEGPFTELEEDAKAIMYEWVKTLI